MPSPVATESVRTGTPDASGGIQVANISSQESSAREILAGVAFSDRIADAPAADRSGLTADDSATVDMSTVGFAGSVGANLFAINNRGALVVWCEFANAGGAATVQIVYYDAANNPLFVGPPMSFNASAQRVAAAGDYLSQPVMAETYGASKYRPYLKTKGTGNVDIFAHPV